jgi:hypothetical protein
LKTPLNCKGPLETGLQVALAEARGESGVWELAAAETAEALADTEGEAASTRAQLAALAAGDSQGPMPFARKRTTVKTAS